MTGIAAVAVVRHAAASATAAAADDGEINGNMPRPPAGTAVAAAMCAAGRS
jgi:hypothetical protein